MAGENSQEQSVGEITSGIETNKLPLETIDFVRRQLPVWRDDPERPDEQSEPELNLQLCKFLEQQARNNFPMVQFTREELQGGHRSVDISTIEKTYSAYKPFMVLECKRLPPPSKDREKEYVTGAKKSGGIQRFKLGLYAADMQIVGMIGYVQQHSAKHWYEQINKWISQLSQGISNDCVWTDREMLELLEEDVSTGIAHSKSAHSRSDDPKNLDLTIHHLWIVMHSRNQRSTKN
jgi:hypothetical protein